jgi:hypothetical protein
MRPRHFSAERISIRRLHFGQLVLEALKDGLSWTGWPQAPHWKDSQPVPWRR